jgi:ketosteroid isomerase-like protein
MENLEVVRTLLLSESDMVDFVANPLAYVGPERLAVLHPEIRCRWISRAQSTEQQGRAGFVEGWRDWLEPYSRYYLTTEELLDMGDRVVSLVNVVALTRHDGVELSHSPAAVWTFRDGLIVDVAFYLDRDTALAEAGT